MEIIQRFFAALMAFFMAIATFFGFSSPKKTPQINNVIYMIGDGMGPLHLEKTKHDEGKSLVMDTLPQQGFAMTYSATDEVTDSAAAGTALSCGVKTYNGAVCNYWFDDENNTHTPGTHPKTITQLCMENGMKTGVITTDSTVGATPAAFSSRAAVRQDYDAIAKGQLASGIDLIWGKDNGTVTASDVKAAGYQYVTNMEEMNSLTAGTKSFALFDDSLYHTYNRGDSPTLSQMTDKAIQLLSADGKNGFFLMVEGAHIDKKSHDNNEKGMTDALLEFDNAVKVALDFAEKDEHTLIVVTADHETGGIVCNEDGSYSFTRGNHSAADVPVRAFGPYEFIKKGEVVENIWIPCRIAAALRFNEKSFPCEVKDS